MALLADIFWPLLQVLISALRMSRGQVAQENGLFENKTRKDPSNSVKMDLRSCASSLNTLLQNVWESNISTWNITLIFPKFLLLVEMDGVKEGNEDNSCAPLPVPPMESSFHSAGFHNGPQPFVTGRATGRAEEGSMAWSHQPRPLPREQRTTCTDPRILKVFPQRPRKYLHWESHSCVGLWGASKLFHHESEKSWVALSRFDPQN